MCGLAGFVGPGDSKDIEKMCAELAHRGPDADGFWYDHDKGIYIGHKRLSIIDIAFGAQPMWSADGSLCAVYNGEIYNHAELRRELEKLGYQFKTDHSDTEVLLYGYKEWGEKLPSHLNGMWAFAIYDKRNEKIYLSRDRFGKKPLYYTLQHKTFAFASELNALIRHRHITASISERSLKKYFAYGYIPAPSSLYTDIHKLPGGYNLIFDLKKLSCQLKQYWDFVLEPFDTIPKNPEEEWGEQIRDLLSKAVQRRLMADVPLGVFLSGGIDSSAVTAFASKYIPAGKLKTFSIGFTEASYDETDYAQLVAEKFQTDHRMEKLSMERSRDVLVHIADKIDEPLGDSSLLPTFLLCREARKHVTVALGGDGGDELFAGYSPFKALQLAKIYTRFIPKPLHFGIMMAMNRLPVSHRHMSFDFKLKRTLRGISYPKHLWNAVWLGPLDPKEINELFQEPADIEDIYSEAIEYWDGCKQDNLIDKTLQFYTKLYLQDDILVKTDRASMMNSLEVRAPFLDIELVDFVRKIPHSWKFRKGQTKYIFKKAMKPILPDSILYRHKKGFGAPIGSWFKQGLLKIDTGKLIQGVREDAVRSKIFEHQQDIVDHHSFLWDYWLLNTAFCSK